MPAVNVRVTDVTVEGYAIWIDGLPVPTNNNSANVQLAMGHHDLRWRAIGRPGQTLTITLMVGTQFVQKFPITGGISIWAGRDFGTGGIYFQI